MNIRIVFTLIHLGALLGCAPQPSEFTVEYYRAHADERREKVAECANDPGALRKDALCINAREAEVIESVGSLRKLPPMGLAEAEQKAKEAKKSRQTFENAQE